MRLALWDTRTEPDRGFVASWRETIATASHAHFAFNLAYLDWEARHGRHSIAAAIEEGARAGAVVLRREGGALRSGWPWRWQMVLAEPARTGPVGLLAEDVEWFLGHAREIAGSQRLEWHVPAILNSSGTSYLAGATIIRPIEMPDQAILQSLDGNKRRAIRRARREGFEVIEARGIEALREFSRLKPGSGRRHALLSPEVRDPAPGEAWREWEHPWMWLLVAVREGRIEAGSGFGLFPGAIVDYRANASSELGRRLGANALLGFEAIRRARDLGHRWMNWAGANEFKRELGGDRIAVRCWLGGGRRWTPRNLLFSTALGAIPSLARWRMRRAARAVAVASDAER